jgi:5'(3')-deoxyribonucleotidase
MKGYVDLDGVLFDWVGSAAKILNVDLTNPVTRDFFKNNTNAMDLHVGKGRMWKGIDAHGEDFWANLELFPWAVNLWKYCVNYFGKDNLYICTAPSDNPACAAGKVRAIKKHFNTKHFVITPRKAACASPRSFLIDDTEKQIQRFTDAGGTAFLWPNSLVLLDHPGALADTMNSLQASLEAWRVSQASLQEVAKCTGKQMCERLSK